MNQPMTDEEREQFLQLCEKLHAGEATEKERGKIYSKLKRNKQAMKLFRETAEQSFVLEQALALAAIPVAARLKFLNPKDEEYKIAASGHSQRICAKCFTFPDDGVEIVIETCDSKPSHWAVIVEQDPGSITEGAIVVARTEKLKVIRDGRAHFKRPLRFEPISIRLRNGRYLEQGS